MKNIISLCGLALCLALCCGCEWTGGGGVDYWSGNADWVDFSGTYKGSEGTYAVLKSGTGSNQEPSYSAVTNTVTGELISTGDNTTTAFGGILAHPSVPGTLNIEVGTVGGYRFWDREGGSGTAQLSVAPEDGSSGSINYSTGAWSLNFPAPPSEGAKMLASYLYTVTDVINPAAQQGNHGNPIYSFVIYQTGNRLQITDNNGSSYEGTMGSLRASGGYPSDYRGETPPDGPVEAQFSAAGVSQGFNVTIVGILHGTYRGGDQGGQLTGRTMTGTFIEDGGFSSEISASW